MAWDQLWIDKPHLAYALIGGFTTIFSLCSLFVKEKLYIGEATVATIFGVIVGPHALNWFSPTTWGNTDFITLEISRIVLVVQIFAVAVELPKKYMLKHLVSVTILLLPVMTFGWLISSVFIWKLVPSLSWVEGLALAACVTATDPVLASAVVGKGKFAKRVPGHLRNLLSAESGCNDGMAFPFAYLAINCIKYAGQSNKIAFHFIVITVLYECVFGCILGAVIGYVGRHSIKFAEKHNLIDRESFLSFYFVLALFCTGVGSIIGTDDLLVSFAAGTAFSWDGWFTRKTEESHVSNVIDLLINMSFFVYFGAIVPWEQFNNAAIGIKAWKLVILAILILVFRRLPIIMAMKPFTPDIRTWREALFCGHFGPIGVGAIFISILSRAELESGEPTPLAHLPPVGSPNYNAVATIWPVTTFLVIASIVVHGSSIAVFTLGKRLNNMTITMSYTTGGNSQSWLQRLPRIESGRTLSLHKVDTEEPSRFRIGKKAKPAGGAKKKRWADEARERPHSTALDLGGGLLREVTEEDREEKINDGIQAYQEGRHIIVEDESGEVINEKELSPISEPSSSSIEDGSSSSGSKEKEKVPETILDEKQDESGRKKGEERQDEDEPMQRTPRRQGTNTKVVAYQLDDNIIVENDEGEVIRRYRINRRDSNATQHEPRSTLDRTLSWVGLRRTETATSTTAGGVTSSTSPNAPGRATATPSKSGKDLEKQEEDLVRIDKNDDLPVDEDTMKKQLKQLIRQQTERHHGLSTSHHKDDVEDGVESSNASPPRSPRSTSPRSRPSKRRLSFTGLRRTTSQSSQGSTPASPSTKPSTGINMPRGFLGPAHESSDDEEESHVSHDVDYEETEVERKRRLAALGVSEDGNDSDDEEVHGSSSHGARTGVPPAIQEDDESDDHGDTTSSVPHGITWGNDVKKH